jgi:hypothetical protein
MNTDFDFIENRLPVIEGFLAMDAAQLRALV